MANLSLVSASLPLGEFGALQKMRLAVAMPLILVGIVAAYSVLKFVSVHCSSTANHDVRARLSRFLVHKAVTVLSSLFTALSIFYMRAILRPFN
jgi:choline-glycine betaine transporter